MEWWGLEGSDAGTEFSNEVKRTWKDNLNCTNTVSDHVLHCSLQSVRTVKVYGAMNPDFEKVCEDPKDIVVFTDVGRFAFPRLDSSLDR